MMVVIAAEPPDSSRLSSFSSGDDWMSVVAAAVAVAWSPTALSRLRRASLFDLPTQVPFFEGVPTVFWGAASPMDAVGAEESGWPPSRSSRVATIGEEAARCLTTEGRFGCGVENPFVAAGGLDAAAAAAAGGGCEEDGWAPAFSHRG
jgi:hypothetical protein